MMRAWVVGFVFSALGYAGPEACASCHRAETAHFAHASMTRALESAQECEVLRTHPKLTANIGGYSYLIERQGEQSFYSVTDGARTIRVPIGWAFGLGSAGQTYAFQRDGNWYESTVSFYSALNGLDLTMGAQGTQAKTLDEAAGQIRLPKEIAQCFDCHATNAVAKQQLSLPAMIPGLMCERCHGPSDQHLAALRPMKKLGKLTSEEMSDFCGQCHRTWAQIAKDGPHGVFNVRFQPYRLTNSKCYDADDNRIRCTTCHDPHAPVETSAAAYDSKCTACHSAGAKARICKVSKKDCSTCHMPKIDLPGAHKKFTDHWIRIAKANEKYPD